jgi:adenine-specific DNA-methyltransferase
MFLDDMTSTTKTLSSVITEFNTGDGTKELYSLFGGGIFDFPKPSSFVQFLVDQVTTNNDIILDSFSGSGTTAHAVLNLNQQDGGNRKFILIEMEDYAETITAERVKRVINGYGGKFGTGGSFDYYELGQPLFNEGVLNEEVGVQKIRQYVWYSETNCPYSPPLEGLGEASFPYSPPLEGQGEAFFLGKHNDTAYYFNFEPEKVTTLDHQFLSTMKIKAEQYVVYADNCLLTKEFMTKHHLIFKKIPRDITRF